MEAKLQGATLTGAAAQSARYAQGLSPSLQAWRRSLRFVYESTGIETRLTNGLEPVPRARPVFAFRRPQTLADSDNPPPLDVPAQEIVDDLEAALEQFRSIAGDLQPDPAAPLPAA
jgi:type I site-specific restriction endonuclease